MICPEVLGELGFFKAARPSRLTDLRTLEIEPQSTPDKLHEPELFRQVPGAPGDDLDAVLGAPSSRRLSQVTAADSVA